MISGKRRRRCQRAACNSGRKVPRSQSSAWHANINLFFFSRFFFSDSRTEVNGLPKRRDSPVVYLFNNSNYPYIWAAKGNLVQEQRSKTYNNPKKQRNKPKTRKTKQKSKPRNKIHKTNKETNKLNRLRVLALVLPSPPFTLNTSVSPHCNIKANQEITLTTI